MRSSTGQPGLEIQVLQAGTHTSERWDNYNPFEENAHLWHKYQTRTVPPSCMFHSRLTTERLMTGGWCRVNSTLNYATTAVGENFINLGRRSSILMCTALN